MSEDKVRQFRENPFQFGKEETRTTILQILSAFFMDFDDIWRELRSRQLTKQEITALGHELEALRLLTHADLQQQVDNDPELSALLDEVAKQNKNKLN